MSGGGEQGVQRVARWKGPRARVPEDRVLTSERTSSAPRAGALRSLHAHMRVCDVCVHRDRVCARVRGVCASQALHTYVATLLCVVMAQAFYMLSGITVYTPFCETRLRI